MPPALRPRSWLSRLQVGASLAGGGAWTPVFLAGDSLAVQEGRLQSTRRRKRAALGSPTGGSPTARRGHKGPFPAGRQVERRGPEAGRGQRGRGQPWRGWPPERSPAAELRRQGVRASWQEGCGEAPRGLTRRPWVPGFRATAAGRLSLQLSVSQQRAELRPGQAALRARG